MGNLTKNFSYKEFRPYGSLRTWKPKGFHMDYMLKALSFQFQKIRGKLGHAMIITSGVRNPEVDFKRMKAKGYNPSYTSDHYFNYPVKIPKTNHKFKRYGSVYSLGVGAGDVVFPTTSIYEAFKFIVKMSEKRHVRFGQIIYERYKRKNGTLAEWIHFGNEPTLIFNPLLVKFFPRKRYLTSVNGGKSYQIYKPN